MNTERHVEDRIRSWLLETAPAELPDRVFDATFERTRSMSQASGVRPWRTPSMNPLARMAAAVITVVLVIGTGAYLLGPGGQLGGTPTSSPSTSATPLPTLTAKASASALATPSSSTDPKLDTTTWTPFTSQRYGYRDAVPPGFQVRPATKPWVVPEGPNTTNDEWDQLSDPMDGTRYWSSSVGLPAGQTFEAWAADYRRRQVDPAGPAACDQTKQSRVTVTIDGSPAVLRVGCQELEALILRGGRVYSFGGVESFSSTFGVSEPFRALYDRWLTTIVLDPAAARELPDASPSPG